MSSKKWPTITIDQALRQCPEDIKLAFMVSLGQLPHAPAPLVCAVSGGADSIGLLLVALAALGKQKVAAVSVDHSQRAESAIESAEVFALCTALSIPCDVQRVQVEEGGSLEARLRGARYRAINQSYLMQGPLSVLATGHTAEDQLETMLMRLGRGSSTRGLAGIRLTGPQLVRPLLSVSKWAIRDWLTECGVSWFEDPTNADTRFSRNATRAALEALPRGLHGRIAIQSAWTAQCLAEDDDALTALSAIHLAELIDQSGAIDRTAWLTRAPAIRRRTLLGWMQKAGLEGDFDRRSLARALDTLSNGGQANLPGDFRLDARSAKAYLVDLRPLRARGKKCVTQLHEAEMYSPEES